MDVLVISRIAQFIITAAAVLTASGVIWGLLGKRIKSYLSHDALKQEMDCLREMLETHMKNDETWQLKENETQMAIIKDRIAYAHAVYTTKGEVDTYSLASITKLTEIYHELGGNSFVKSLVNEIKKLPIV